MADKNFSIDISAADKTAAAFASVKKGLGEIDSKVAAVKSTFSAFAAIGAGIGITDLFKEAVAATSKAEQSSNRLNAVLKATGETVGFTREQLDKMAVSLSKSTTFDDEDIRDAQSNLIKFGRLHGETFERALKLSADYAAFTGGPMVEATQLIGKALADPANGVTALGKALGKLTQTEQEAIDKFTSIGDKAGAAEVIFNKLEKSIGGTAGAMNTGLYGATTATAKAWDDFLKALGKTAPVQLVVTGGMSLITEGLNLITEAIDKQNKVWVHNPLLNGGKLQPLPEAGTDPLKALQGSRLTIKQVQDLPPGLRPSIVPPGQNAITVDEMRARGMAARAKEEEAQEARREGAAAREKARMAEIKKADESFWQLANLKLESNDQYNKSVQETIKVTRELEDLQVQHSVVTLEAQAQLELAAAAQMKQNMDHRNADDADKAAHQLSSLNSLQLSLLTENEARKFAYEQDVNLLNAALGDKVDAQGRYYMLLGRLVLNNEKKRTEIEDAEIKKRFGIANVYRRADIDAAGFFFNTLSGLMTTKNRQLFEIGKAAAIAGAIIDTWKAATGAYAALASIPIVGPALGAAAAAAAVAVGFARVAAIKSTTMGSSGGAVGTFAANPNTGLPESPTSSGFESPAPVGATQAQVAQRKDINITILGEGLFSATMIRDSLIPLINDAVGDGVTLRATVLH